MKILLLYQQTEEVLMRNLTRRMLSVLLIITMLFSLAACANGKNMWDPYAKETGSPVSASSSGEVSGDIVAETVDENPYFSGKAVSVYSFSEDFPWAQTSVIEFDDSIGVFLQINDNSVGESQNSGISYQYLLKMYDLEGEFTGEVDFSGMIGANDYIGPIYGDSEGNIHIQFYPNEGISMQELVADRYGNIVEERHDTVRHDYASFTDAAGNTYVISDESSQTHSIGSDTGNNGPQLSVYDAEGGLVSSFPVDISNEKGSLTLCQIDDMIYISTYYDLYPIDLENETIGDPITYNDNDWYAQPLFLKNGIYFDEPDGFYQYDLTTQANQKMITWNDTDLDLTRYKINNWIPVSDDKIIGVGKLSERTVLSSGSFGSVEMVILSKEDSNPNLSKETIILGGFNISRDDDICAAVSKFNYENMDYRIEVKDYIYLVDTTDISGADYYSVIGSKAADLMRLDILNGSAPDILCVRSEFSYFPVERIEKQGLLLDLYELAADDETFHKEDYVQSILSLLEVDGKLYRFPMDFGMHGLVGPTRLLGERSGWTIEEFDEFADGLPEGAVVFPNTSKKWLMQYFLASSMSTFVDYNEGMVNFDSPEFCRLLEFINTYGGEELDFDDPSLGEWDNPVGYIDTQELMTQGMLAIDFGWLYSVSEISDGSVTMFEEPVTYIGYPSPDRSGMVCSPGPTFSIFADCNNPQVAWSFISMCIGEESQKENSLLSGIPIHQGVLEEKTEQVLNMPKTDTASWYGFTGVTREDVDIFLGLVDSISALSGEDNEIFMIVDEEAQAYYQGAKTAEEVAAIIQNRVSNFVSEVS